MALENLNFNLNFTKSRLSKNQQYILLLVFASGFFLGTAAAIVSHSIRRISYNSSVIVAEDQSIVKYSQAIKNFGICPKPKGEVYTAEEIKKCSPNSVELSEVPNTLRSNILENMATNAALNSVPKESSSTCINPITEKAYTSEELTKLYRVAKNDEERTSASRLIRSCSALRVIPDALPSSKNEEALLSSLNKIFLISGWTPDSLSPSGESYEADFGNNLNTFQVNLSLETDIATTMRVLNNVERSIRDFNITHATIEWNEGNSLVMDAKANAYYMDATNLREVTKTMSAGGN